MKRLVWGLGLGLAIFVVGCSCDDSTMTAPDAGGGQPIPVGVETVAPLSVRAGQIIMVTCLLLDDMGEAFTPPPEYVSTLRFVPQSSVEENEDGNWVATTAGEVEVACNFPSLLLTDDTPAVVEITPGEPAFVQTTLERDSIEAGEDVRAGCEVFDAYGNRITGEIPTYRSEPADDANSFVGSLGNFERAGRFDVYCELPGTEAVPAELEVRAGLPASLVIARVPDQPTYGVGQVIDIRRIVTDQFDNPVPDALVPVRSAPTGPEVEELGDGRFRFYPAGGEGRYILTASVTPPTYMDIPLNAQTEIIIDETGPLIDCEYPLDGATLDRTPGSSLTFRGSVADLSGVMEVRVNGAVVDVDTTGGFTTPLTTRYGINFIDISAIDGDGQETSRTCAFLAATEWAPDDRVTGDLISLSLQQAAFDDGNRSDPLDSMADILHTVLNSSGLRNELHAALLGANPLKPNACDATFIVCVLRSEVLYQDLSVPGPNTVDLDLVNGGLAASVRIEDLGVRIRVRGHVAGIPYDTTGWVTFDYVEVDTTFNTTISGGQPHVSIRPGTTRTRVGTIRTSFDGLDGAIINIVVSLFNGVVRDLVADLATDYIADNFDDILDGLLGGLDITTFGTSFNVPRLDSSGTIPLSFGIGFTDPLATSTSRMLFGIGTRFSAPPAHARTTFGAPMQVGTRRLDIGGTGTTRVAVHEAVLNQALHALWRGGFFDATLDGATLGLPDGISAALSTGLPPVVETTDRSERVLLSIGAMQLYLIYPDLFSEPVNVSLGARASMAVTLVGEDLVFSDFRMEELYFSTDLSSLPMDDRDALEGFFAELLEEVLGTAINDALPAIPIPSFELPASLAPFGLPAGSDLGIVSPTLSTEEPHFVLRGNFAVR